MGLLYRTKHSLVCNLIVYYHYRTVHNKETVIGEEIFKSHVACLLTFKFPCVMTSAFPNRGWRETLPPSFERKYQLPIKFINCATFPENKTGSVFPTSTIKKFHSEIVFVAWLRDLSWCDDRFSRTLNWTSVETTWLTKTETRHDFLVHGDLLRLIKAWVTLPLTHIFTKLRIT